MINASLSEMLAQACGPDVQPGRPVGFSSGIRFDGDNSHLIITLNQRGVTAGMQRDEAAFEAWSLHLNLWCNVEQIELRWSAPRQRATEAEQRHFRRFLYRAQRFQSLFPEWFHLGQAIEETDSFGSAAGSFALNLPGCEIPPEPPITVEGRRVAEEESTVAKNLLCSTPFRSRFGLRKANSDFPVQVFRTSEEAPLAQFPPGNIDLIGVGGGLIKLFELKVRSNSTVGALTELLYYTEIIRDLLPGAGTSPAIAVSAMDEDTAINRMELSSVVGIEAILAAEKFHRLVGNESLFAFLNEAAARHWADHVPVRFTAVRLTGSAESGYEFKNISKEN